ncbi:dapper homolog 1 [Thunnus maccoyii]|uniref:dapper homolog 1 n=1 Tax=Thunnus maccoyii TaxID=8240 RepID=UPI001C4CC178|nr:dapper homolog 1 [Thunnus maccoyii]
MLLSGASSRVTDRCSRDTDGRCSRDTDRCSRDRAAAEADADAAERLRTVRERLDATVSGLGELEYLRQRQEVLVRAALELREEAVEAEEERRREAQLSSEEKLLEENILLLRKQLNCLRRRDAGLITQLQELDRQISDLRLDTEASHDQLETDSRPSSGFYELSDGASGSLSNSSNSVFSECFCSTADADGRLPTSDELASCFECDGLVGGLFDDSSSTGTVRRSLSAPHPPTLDPVSSVASCDTQSKYHCDLLARNGSDVYRYPSPLHAVAVQSSIFLQMLGNGGHSRDEGILKSGEAGGETLKPESSPLPVPVSVPLVPQSSSWPPPSSSSQTPSQKRLDSYIYSLLQRRAQPVRTSKPRTSISTDPSKSILRQASLCVRQVTGPSYGSGLGTLRGSEIKPSWAAEGAATSSPQRQCSVESKSEEQETQNGFHGSGVDTVQNGLKINSSDFAQNQTGSPLNNSIQTLCSVTNKDIHTSTNSLLKKKSKGLLPPSGVSTATLPKDFRELGSPKANSCPKETKQPCYPSDQDPLLKSPPIVKTQSDAPKNSPKPLQTGQTETGDRSVLELASLGSSSQSQDEGGGGGGSHMVNAKYIPAQRQNVKLCKGGSKNVKVVKVKSRASEHNELTTERRGDKSHHRSSSKKSRILEDGSSTHLKVYRRAAGGAPGASSSRIKRLPASIPEGRVLDKHATSTLSSVRSGVSRQHHHGNHHHNGGNHHHHGQSHHHHHHGRDQVVVVAKPKYKRNDYRRLRAIMEVPYDEAFRRAQRRQRKELLNHSAANGYLPSAEQLSSPYSYVAGSDSEYSAECASLFHSTIVDTSEDDRSNYTTNCFGDSESSEEEYIEESTTTSDTEESGGGGAGGGAGGMGRGWSQLGAAGTRAARQEMTPAQAKAFVKIKASHNLKKKILRFRSGSLKLMTTV